MAYAVLTRIYPDTFENVWSEDGAPLVFETKRAAVDALKEHLDDMMEAYLAGDIACPDRPSNFQIAKLDNR
jgi:hypothetical protein